MKNLPTFFIATLLSLATSLLFSQSKHTFQSPGFYNSIQWSKEERAVNTIQAWVSSNNFYFEARYNYEDVRTFSLYVGRTFETGKTLQLIITPSAGLVFGNYNGISLATYLELNGKWINAFSENEFVFDENDKLNNFFFTWSGATFPIHKNVGIGIGSKWTILSDSRSLNYGPMISFEKGGFKLEGYAFNVWESAKVWTIGIQYQFGNDE